MIAADMTLTVERIPLSCLQVIEHTSCHIEKVIHYTQLLRDYPDQDMEPMMVAPSETHPGMFRIQNGKHRFMSYILAERTHALCVVMAQSGQASETVPLPEEVRV